MSDVLLDRLDDVRSRLRRVHLLAGAAQCLLALIGLLAAFFILDWMVLSRIIGGGAGDQVARGLLLLTMVGMFALVVVRTIVAELRTQRSDDQIAMRVERSHPELRGRLISTVQLTRMAGDHGTMVSEEMIEALEEETVGFTEAIDFGSIINRRLLKRVGIAALALLLLSVGLGWWRRDFTGALLARMALTRTAYPTAASIIAVSHGGVVGKGEPFAIELELDPTRKVPDEATAAIRPVGGKNSDLQLKRVLDAPDGRVLFRGSVAQALEDFDFRPAALDARWPTWEHVRVNQRPTVKALSVTSTFPAYLARAPETSAIGDLRVPVGTVVKIHAILTKAVTEATLSRRTPVRKDLAKEDASRDEAAAKDEATPNDSKDNSKDNKEGAKDPGPREQESTSPMELDATRTAADATLSIDANGSYAIRLRDADGFENASPISYTITAIPDRVPTVTIQYPAQDKSAAKYAQWPIRFSARDDHSISKGWLKYVIADPDAVGAGQEAALALATSSTTAEAAAKSIELEGLAQPGETQIARQVLFDLSRLNLVEGQRVTYWIDVSDNRLPEPNIGSSPHFSFTVVDLATLKEQFERDRAELLGTIKTLRDKQKEVHDAVDTVRKQVP